MPPTVIVQECTLDVVPQHSLCFVMQPLFIGYGGASRLTPFEAGGDDEDIPKEDKVQGDEDVEQGQATPEEKLQEDNARKLQPTGSGTTALLHPAVLPAYYRGQQRV